MTRCSGRWARCDNRVLRILHVIHDFLPRHRAGSEIYAFDLSRAQSRRHDVTLLSAEYDPSRRHGEVTWRVHEGLPVAEITNNWRCRTFADTYRSETVTSAIRGVLHAVQPHAVHLHSLLNLSFELPRIASSLHVPVVATLHDYSLVCPSGGQRVHRAEQHVCTVIDTERCVRCFRQSPFFAQIGFAAMTSAAPRPGIVFRAARTVAQLVPGVTARVLRRAQQALPFALTRQDVDERLDQARTVFADVDRWIAPSPAIGDEYMRLGIEPSKIHVSDYGFVPLLRSTRTRPRRPLRIGYVGTLVWHKGVHLLLDAVRSLPSELYEVTIHGDTSVFPDYSAELKTRASGLPVRFAGGFDRDDAPDVYARMDVLVVPSIWMENSPLVIHEAFMAGVPVVGARSGGIPHLVHDGVTGFLYDASSPNALATVLRHLVEHPDVLAAVSVALSSAPAVKSIDDDARQLEAMYDSLRAAKVGSRDRTLVGDGRAS